MFGLEGFSIYSKAMEVMKYFDIEDLGSIDVPTALAKLREAGKDRTALLAVTAQNTFLLKSRANAQPASLSNCPISNARWMWSNSTR